MPLGRQHLVASQHRSRHTRLKTCWARPRTRTAGRATTPTLHNRAAWQGNAQATTTDHDQRYRTPEIMMSQACQPCADGDAPVDMHQNTTMNTSADEIFQNRAVDGDNQGRMTQAHTKVSCGAETIGIEFTRDSPGRKKDQTSESNIDVTTQRFLNSRTWMYREPR